MSENNIKIRGRGGKSPTGHNSYISVSKKIKLNKNISITTHVGTLNNRYTKKVNETGSTVGFQSKIKVNKNLEFSGGISKTKSKVKGSNWSSSNEGTRANVGLTWRFK
tara:strand:- start:2 stop:325 length:324 start_codon:yes stop_codon:yes gene_type:complete